MSYLASRTTPERTFSEGEKFYLASLLVTLVKQWECPDYVYPPTIVPKLYVAISEEISAAYPTVEKVMSAEQVDLSRLQDADWLRIREKASKLERLYQAFESAPLEGDSKSENSLDQNNADSINKQLLEAFSRSDEYAKALIQMEVDRLNAIREALECAVSDYDPCMRPLISEAKTRIRTLCAKHDEALHESVSCMCDAIIAAHLLTKSLSNKEQPHLRKGLNNCVLILGKTLYEDESALQC